MKRLLLALLLLLPALAQEPRTQDMLDYFQWALQTPLTQGQTQRLQDILRTIHDQGQESSLQPLYDQISNLDILPSGTRGELRRQYRGELLGLNGALGDLAREINQDACKPLVQGNPPLTQQAVEAFAEFYLFALGHEGPPPGPVFNDSMAVTLQQIYPTLTAQQQQRVASTPALWASLRARWPGLSASEQASLRSQWQQTLAPLVARRRDLAPAFAALESLRQAYQGGDPSATAAAAQAVSAQALRLRGAGTPEALALAGRLEKILEQADTLAEINQMSAEIADRTHLPLSDPTSMQPVVTGGLLNNWAAQDVSGMRYRW